jgi:ubiquinone/menaquinone biosynthesis C-methylase UbiE
MRVETMTQETASPEATQVYSAERLKKQILSEPFFGDAVQFVLAKIGSFENKTILDNGCGAGEISVLFAHEGGNVVGIDKSPIAIGEAKMLARSYRTEHRCRFINCNSESMPIADASIDIVFSRSTMQYMDAEKVLNEYMRILRPSGILAIMENLRYNPFINGYRLYRSLSAKTSGEVEYVKSIRKYLSVRQVEEISAYFIRSDHREYHCFRMLSLYLRMSLNKSLFARKLDVLLFRIDTKLFELFPLLRHFAWFTAVVCQEKNYRKDIEKRQASMEHSKGQPLINLTNCEGAPSKSHQSRLRSYPAQILARNFRHIE